MTDCLSDIKARLQGPLKELAIEWGPMPLGATSVHSLLGGEDAALERLTHFIERGIATAYHETRNGLLGTDSSSKLSAYLALGCITARQVHAELVKLEDGIDEKYAKASGYGEGETRGSAAVRYELLWRDYMRLSAIKYGNKLFHLHGFKEGSGYEKPWLTPNAREAAPGQNPSPQRVAQMIERLIKGTTGMGLIDASQRELFHTGFTSNRARQNVASFLAKHLSIDWRIGAEWYECLLVDYDPASNWANWQYVAGVGNDPRDKRVFNPVKQAHDYDNQGEYVRGWLPELREISDLSNVFQVCTTPAGELHRAGLMANEMVVDPLKRIHFTINHKRQRNWSKRGNHGNRVH
ncbi:putative cryptochrome DASH [Escovopsis weberi]|uniref:Cryptochrome DASH n=1 Tax=Escovopsis weberi TaxID=150374 RepID=A0A0M9VWT0_ESCWE|nr:putative cryptochrome DASH [Escovopsis weberi]